MAGGGASLGTSLTRRETPSASPVACGVSARGLLGPDGEHHKVLAESLGLNEDATLTESDIQLGVKREALAGLTVALAMVPEAVAFAFVAGVHPLVGLYAAALMCLVTSAMGGRPGMISGATGATAVVMVSLVGEHGVEYMFAAVVLMGLLQIAAGVLRVGKVIRLVSQPVMLGFVNGLAIVIGLAQLENFQAPAADGVLRYMAGMQLNGMLSLTAATMACIYLLPLVTKAVPPSLVAIVVVSFVSNVLGVETRVVGDLASIGGGLPALHFPSVPWDMSTLKVVLPYSCVLAAVGLIESLLTLTVVDDLTETHGDIHQEAKAQGVANIVCGLFGGMGGCALLGHSMINIQSGGRGRLSGIAASCFLMVFVLSLSPLVEMIPLASLVGVMFMVVARTFLWSGWRVVHRIPMADAVVLVLVSAVTVLTNLAVAAVVGVVLSALLHCYRAADDLVVDIFADTSGRVVYAVSGNLFFGTCGAFAEKFNHREDGGAVVDFRNSRLCDYTAVEAILSVSDRYKAQGKELTVRGLTGSGRDVAMRGGIAELIED